MKIFNDLFDSIKAINIKDDQVRKFGFLLLFILFALIALFYMPWENVKVKIIFLSILFVFMGIAWPLLLRWLYLTWMSVSVVAGYFISRLLLTLIYYLLISPIGFLVKIFKGDVLKTKIDKKAFTYWIKKEEVKDNKNELEQLF